MGYTKEEIAAQKKEYRANNKEEIVAYGKEYYESHKEEIAARNKAYWKTAEGSVSLRRRHIKQKAERRNLGNNELLTLKEGEDAHHITNADVIGVPNQIHQQLSGHSRKRHRTLVLQWLKINDKRKYKIALCALASVI
jgi:hypothetical protein